jgi:sortase B
MKFDDNFTENPENPENPNGTENIDAIDDIKKTLSETDTSAKILPPLNDKPTITPEDNLKNILDSILENIPEKPVPLKVTPNKILSEISELTANPENPETVPLEDIDLENISENSAENTTDENTEETTAETTSENNDENGENGENGKNGENTENPENPENPDKLNAENPENPENGIQIPQIPKTPKVYRKPTYTDVLKELFPWKGDSKVNKIRKSVFIASLCVFAVCLYFVTDYFWLNYQNKKSNDGISDFYRNSSSSSGTIQLPARPGDPEWKIPMALLPEAANMLAINPDYVGFLEIEDTSISYPVVQRSAEGGGNDYYLYRDFYQKENRSGSIYLDYRCNFDRVVDGYRSVKNSDNLTLYGHEMKDGQMFGLLKQYRENYNFYGDHPIINLDSAYAKYKFKIFSACIVNVDPEQGEVFDVYNTINFENEEKFYEYVNGCKRRSVVSNDVDVKYGDQLLTLVTCSTMFSGARFVVIARQVREGEDLLAGTQNNSRNTNVLMPDPYYRWNNVPDYNPDDFVPFG